jgi:MFS family permease
MSTRQRTLTLIVMCVGALMLPCGDFGDRHGHKRVVLAGLATFGFGSLGADLAPEPGILIASPRPRAGPSHASARAVRWPRVCCAPRQDSPCCSPAPCCRPSCCGGAGLGILTPAVVAASMGAVPSERAGLAAAVNNTARQAGGAVGVAAFGSIAGSPTSAGFVHGFHAVALGAAGLYALAAAMALAAAPGPVRRCAGAASASSASG